MTEIKEFVEDIKHSFIWLQIHNMKIDMEELVYEIADEKDAEQKEFLLQLYHNDSQMLGIALSQLEEKRFMFSFKHALEKGQMSYDNLWNFKPSILMEGVTEEEWKKKEEEYSEGITKDRIQDRTQNSIPKYEKFLVKLNARIAAYEKEWQETLTRTKEWKETLNRTKETNNESKSTNKEAE